MKAFHKESNFSKIVWNFEKIILEKETQKLFLVHDWRTIQNKEAKKRYKNDKKF